MKKKIWETFVLLLMVSVLIGLGWLAGYLTANCPATHEQSSQFNLPTIEQVQEFLGCEKIDGKLGDSWRTSETQRLWDAALNAELFNGYAAKYFTKEFYLNKKAGTPCKSEK